jgi:CotH kinase protein/Lectin C-type domain/Putative metal-binding motif
VISRCARRSAPARRPTRRPALRLGLLLALGLGLLLASGCKKPRPLFERIFALDEIPTFHISLSPEARAALAQRPREWVRGGFAYQDEKLEGVGIRLKGHRSLRKLGEKSSFKIQLDRFEKKQKLAKQTTITLNNMVEDPSLMREVLAYRLYRALGVAAPRAGFAEVVLDGEPQGMYAVIESIDKKFLKARFPRADGPIYEGEWGCDVVPEDVGGFDQDGGPPDRRELARFAEVAAGGADQLFGAGSPLDVPAFLRFVAVEMYVGNFDGYRHGHNYRLYLEPDRGRWYFIPWGLDRTFVKSLSIFDSQGYLAKRCFADARCRTEYVRAMRAVVAEARRLGLERGVDVISVVTREAAARDPRRAAEITAARAELRAFLVDRPREVERELGCLDEAGREVDRDGDGHACGDCNDGSAAIHPGAAEACDGVDNDCDGVVDDAPCACAPLEAGGARFAICDPALPYTEAQKICAARGEELAWVDDAEQAAALRAAANARRAGRRTHESWWLGLDDRAEEGKFRRRGGSTAGAAQAFSYWQRGEPDNAGCNQDCAVLDTDDGRWRDTHCLEHRPFICRAPAPAPASTP